MRWLRKICPHKNLKTIEVNRPFISTHFLVKCRFCGWTAVSFTNPNEPTLKDWSNEI